MLTRAANAAQWTYLGWRWRRAARAAWRDGHDILTALHAAATAPTQQLYELREACPICGGRHCAGCDEPARVTANPHRHIARHCMDEVPPSLRWLAERVEVCFRATLISANLVGRHVTRPADGTAFRLWAKRKLGRELRLGTTRKVVLP